MDKGMTRRDFLRLMGVSGATALASGSLCPAIGYKELASRMGGVDPDKYAVIVLVDGLRADMLFEMLKEGKLPNIEKHLAARGVTTECVSTFPSTTGPAHLPFLTGTFPGRNDVTGIRWVDRISKKCRDYCAGLEGVMINKDYGLKVPTIFEILDGEETAAIYGIVNKGATYIERPGMKEAWWVKKEDWQSFDEKAADLFEKWYERELLRYSFVWMPGVDHLSHFNGPNSEIVRAALINVDNQIGKIADILTKRDIYDRTLLGLVSDHGLRDTKKNWNLREYLVSLGLHVKEELGSEGLWTDIYRYNAVVAVSGNAFAHVYLCDESRSDEKAISPYEDWGESESKIRSPFFHGWKWEKCPGYERIRDFPLRKNRKVDLVKSLLEQEAIRFLIVAEDRGKFHIFSSSGHSMIEKKFAGYESPVAGHRYSVVEGEDPLEYDKTPGTDILVRDGNYYSGDDWLRASWNSKYPDAVAQICQLFNSHRCGDIVVLAKPGYDLLAEGHIGSHGALEREEMMTPAILAGPGISGAAPKYARTVDIFPTYLSFFGLNPSSMEIDGRTLDVFV